MKAPMPYFPIDEVAVVARGYSQNAAARRTVSSVYVARALGQGPTPSFMDASLQSGRSGVYTIKSMIQCDSTVMPITMATDLPQVKNEPADDINNSGAHKRCEQAVGVGHSLKFKVSRLRKFFNGINSFNPQKYDWKVKMSTNWTASNNSPGDAFFSMCLTVKFAAKCLSNIDVLPGFHM